MVRYVLYSCRRLQRLSQLSKTVRWLDRNITPMMHLSKFTKRLFTDEWKIPIAVGLISIPFSVLLVLLSINNYLIAPVFLSSFLSGYLFYAEHTSSTRAGFRTGLVGGVFVIWYSLNFATVIFDITRSVSRIVFYIILVGVTSVFGVLLFGIYGAVAGLIGGVVAKRVQS